MRRMEGRCSVAGYYYLELSGQVWVSPNLPLFLGCSMFV